MSQAIRVDGLKQFVREVKRADKGLGKATRLAGNKAADIIVATAKPRVPLGPAKGGHARSSIRVASTQTAVRIKGGGKRFSYYPWLDFGGSVGKGKSVHRPWIKTGRYIWRSFVEHRDEVRDILADELTDVARQAGLDPKP